MSKIDNTNQSDSNESIEFKLTPDRIIVNGVDKVLARMDATLKKNVIELVSMNLSSESFRSALHAIVQPAAAGKAETIEVYHYKEGSDKGKNKYEVCSHLLSVKVSVLKALDDICQNEITVDVPPRGGKGTERANNSDRETSL